MPFFEKLNTLFIAAVLVDDQEKAGLLKRVISASASAQDAAAKIDDLAGVPETSTEVAEGMIDLAQFAGKNRDLDDDTKAELKEIAKKVVNFPEGNEGAELAIENMFSAVVEYLDAIQEFNAKLNFVEEGGE